MDRHRFYSPPSANDGATVTLSASETHHLRNVLRLEVGDQVFVFDGVGREYRCKVVELSGKQTRLAIIAAVTGKVESPLRLTLAQALAKGQKFDLIVQKATEMGVSRIVPLITRHGDVRLTPELATKRLRRWKQISLEALKQCGRRTLVEIAEPLSAQDFPARIDRSEAVFVFSEHFGASITQLLPNAAGRAVTVVIGPEGGWSAEEIALFTESDFGLVRLGPRTLRTETAAIVAVALLQHELGDVSGGREME